MNRRMPNGMYGGVRGERKSPLLDRLEKGAAYGRTERDAHRAPEPRPGNELHGV